MTFSNIEMTSSKVTKSHPKSSDKPKQGQAPTTLLSEPHRGQLVRIGVNSWLINSPRKEIRSLGNQGVKKSSKLIQLI